jgi:2-iminobutanoate/2-iminopropanoate deaminase
MSKAIIESDKAPKAIGPYSQAVRAGNLIFVSGQIPIDPATGQIVDGGIAEQTRQVLENIKAILASAHLSMTDIVKTTILLSDISTFPVVNEIYGGYFSQEPPARATYQVAALPRDALIEIEAVAYDG